MLHLPGLRWPLHLPTDGGDPGGGAGGTPQPTSQPTPSPTKAPEVVALEAEVAALKAAATARDKAHDEARKAHDEKLKGEGKIQELLTAREKELADMRADADLGRGYRERETARIAEQTKALSPEDQALVNAQPSLDLRAQLIARLTKQAAEQKKEPAKAGAQGVAVGTATDVDVEALLKEGWRAEQIKEKHPEAYAKHASGFLGVGHLTSYARQVMAAASKQKNGKA